MRAVAVCILMAIIVIVVLITPQGRAGIRAILFVPQVLPAIPINPQEWVTQDPRWQSVQFPTSSGYGSADLIIPNGGDTHSAVVFFLGVVVKPPREDPRVVALAEGLARSGMAVMIPWSETQLQQRIVLDDIEDLVWAFKFLSNLDFVDPDKVGMGGICTGASMAIVAAQDERIHDDVRFVNSFAGYYDAIDFAKAIATRSKFYGDYVVSWEIDRLTYRMFRNHLMDGVANEADRLLLHRHFVALEEMTKEELDSLSPDGLVVYRLLSGVSYEEVDTLIAQLPVNTKQFLEKISPSTNIDKLKARVLIMHDRADRLVPSEESRRFADAVSNSTDTYFTEFSFFQNQIQVHEGEETGIGVLGYIREAIKLYMHMYNIMRETS